jgi:hypothetical protein
MPSFMNDIMYEKSVNFHRAISVIYRFGRCARILIIGHGGSAGIAEIDTLILEAF